MKVVAVRWRDSSVYVTEQLAECDIPSGVCIVRSVGILVRKRKRHIVIARDCVNGEWRGVMAIPRECIVKMARIV